MRQCLFIIVRIPLIIVNHNIAPVSNTNFNWNPTQRARKKRRYTNIILHTKINNTPFYIRYAGHFVRIIQIRMNNSHAYFKNALVPKIGTLVISFLVAHHCVIYVYRGWVEWTRTNTTKEDEKPVVANNNLVNYNLYIFLFLLVICCDITRWSHKITTN